MSTTKNKGTYPRLEVRPLTDLCTHPDVDRTSSPEARHWLGEQLKAFGLLQLPVLNARTGRLLGGALLVKCVRESGAEAVPTWVVDLDQGLEEAAALALNNHAGEWDWKQVSLVLKRMQGDGHKLGLTGFHDYDTGPLVAAEWDKPALGPLDGSDAKQATMF